MLAKQHVMQRIITAKERLERAASPEDFAEVFRELSFAEHEAARLWAQEQAAYNRRQQSSATLT